MPYSRHLACLTLLLAACGPTDPDGTTSDASTTTTTSSGTTSSPTTTNASTTTDPATTDPATTDPATTDPTTDPATTDPTTGDPPVCGEQSCEAGQVCVLPCCGGPPPSCTELNGRGACDDGQDPIPSDQCQFNPCAGPLCCPPTSCTPDPPFCVAPDALRCTGNSCNTGSCFGMLSGDKLECQCA